MKKVKTLFSFLLIFTINSVFAQDIPEIKSLNNFNLKSNLKSDKTLSPIPASGGSMGFNTGMAIIEGNVGFAIGAFAELKAGTVSFVPQANYWNASEQNNFELAGLARFYLSKTTLQPYIDGGLGINFFNQENTNVTKLSIDIGGGVDIQQFGDSFSLLFDGKYKLIIRDPGNVSCFIFTAGMRFPFK